MLGGRKGTSREGFPLGREKEEQYRRKEGQKRKTPGLFGKASRNIILYLPNIIHNGKKLALVLDFD